MKKVLSILVILGLLVSFAYAATKIEDVNVTRLLTSELKDVRNTAVRARNSLQVSRTKMLDINTNYRSLIDADDLTKLTSIFSDIVTAIDELDDLGINVDTNFPTVQE